MRSKRSSNLIFLPKTERSKHKILEHRECMLTIVIAHSSDGKTRERKLHLSILSPTLHHPLAKFTLNHRLVHLFFRKFSPLNSDRCTFHEIVWKLRTEADVKCFFISMLIKFKVLWTRNLACLALCKSVVSSNFSSPSNFYIKGMTTSSVLWHASESEKKLHNAIHYWTDKNEFMLIFSIFYYFFKSKNVSLHSEAVRTERNCKEKRFVCCGRKSEFNYGNALPAVLS